MCDFFHGILSQRIKLNEGFKLLLFALLNFINVEKLTGVTKSRLKNLRSDGVYMTHWNEKKNQWDTDFHQLKDFDGLWKLGRGDMTSYWKKINVYLHTLLLKQILISDSFHSTP